MDEGSDHTGDSDYDDDDDDDEYDETNPDDVDCESTFYYGPRGQSSGRLWRRNVATRSGGSGGRGDNSTFRIRSKWKKYHYQAVPRAMTIQEEDEEIAGPSTSSVLTSTAAATTTTAVVTPASTTRGAANNFVSLEYLPHNNSVGHSNRIPNIHVTMANERNRHVIIHVNDMELSQDENDCDGGDDGSSGGGGIQLSDNDDDATAAATYDDHNDTIVYFEKKSISKKVNHFAYDSNSVSSV